MNAFLNKLLGLDELRLGAEGVRLDWTLALPAWAWVLIALAVFLAAEFSYRHVRGSRVARLALGTLRAASILLFLLLAAGPKLVFQPESVERDWVVGLIDRSLSMSIPDGPEQATRAAQAQRAIEGAARSFAELDRDRRLAWLAFDASTRDLPAFAGVPDLSADPLGPRTAIAQALRDADRRTAGAPLAGIVLFSDGRSADAPDRASLRALLARQVPVFVVPLGSESTRRSASLASLDAPGLAFVNDLVPVTARVQDLSGPQEIELVDRATGLVLDRRRVEPGPDGTASVTLLTRPGAPSEQATWEVRLAGTGNGANGSGLGPGPGQALEHRVRLVDQTLRILYIDGYPRWEYRYLKNLLVREKSIRSSALLLSPEKKFLQEGTDPIASVPTTPEQWKPFDVIVLGDVRASLFSPEQLAGLREHISSRGAGLMLIAGPTSMPAAWAGSTLADLLPVALSASDGSDPATVRTWGEPVLASPGPAADRLGLMRLADESAGAPWPKELSDPAVGWSRLAWAQRWTASSLKPTAEVLLWATPARGPDAARAPLAMLMRYGAGRVAYLATDEIWRWRYARGETLPERFYLPILRMLARESLARAGRAASLELAPDRAASGSTVRVALRLLDESLARARAASLTLRLTSDEKNARELARVTLRPDEADPTRYLAELTAPAPGTYTLSPADALLAGLDLSARLTVTLPDDELRAPETDWPALRALAELTGGAVVAPDQLSTLPEKLPNREVRILGAPIVSTLWDRPVALALLLTLLTLEWVGRRLLRLS